MFFIDIIDIVNDSHIHLMLQISNFFYSILYLFTVIYRIGLYMVKQEKATRLPVAKIEKGLKKTKNVQHYKVCAVGRNVATIQSFVQADARRNEQKRQ